MASRETNLLKCEFFATKEGGSLFSGNRFVGGMYARWIWRELEDKRMDQKEKRKRNAQIERIASKAHCWLQQSVPHKLWNTEKLSETTICVVKREKLSSTIMKNLNKLKMNDSWW